MVLWKLIRQDFRNLITTPVVVISSIFYPWILLGLFGFIFSSLYGGDGVTSYDYYGITMMLYLILTSITITPNTFLEKKLRQGNIRIAYAPVSKISIYISKVVSSYLFMVFTTSLNIILMKYFNIVNFGGSNFIYVLVLFWVFLLFTVTLGGAVCVILKSEELTNMILGNVTSIFAILSGMFFPVDSLGKVVSKLANLSPLKWILDTTFRIIYDGNFQNYNYIVLGFILLSILCLVIMHFNYKPEEYI